MEQSVSVGDADFERMKNELADKFLQEYEGARIG
jgi:hypothetical protein